MSPAGAAVLHADGTMETAHIHARTVGRRGVNDCESESVSSGATNTRRN
jgi:hypothetical protein